MLKRILTVSVVVMTIFWAVGLAAFVPTAQAAIVSGDLIKASTAAVYYVGADGKRYVFPNDATYFSWYPDFSGVKTVTDGELAALQIGGNVTYRPGVKLIKITTDPKVYAVASDGTLRWVTTAEIAVCLYGASWGTMVKDLSDAFFAPPTYTIGAPINACADYSPAAATAAATSINVDRGLVAGGPIVGTAFTASLAADNPASQTLALGATGVPVLKFNLSGTGTLNEVILKRSGLGRTDDYANVYLYNGDTRLTSGRTISSDTNTVTFSNINLAISGSVTLTVKVEVTATVGNASDQDAISLQSVNGNAVAGITGNLMTIGSVAVSAVTVAEVSGSWNITLGSSDAEIGKFSVVAGANDAVLYSITLRQGGTLSNSNLANLILKSGTYELASAATLTADKAIFVLATPFTIPKGQTKNFTVYGDITGGRTNDNIQFYIDEKTDVNIMDAQYGVGVAVTNNFASGDQIVTMQGGQLTLANAGPASTTFSVNSTANAVLKVNVSAERNVTVRKTKMIIAIAGNATDTVAGVHLLSDVSYVKNLKIVDLDSGNTLVGPIADLAAFKQVGAPTLACTVATSPCFYESSESFDLTAGSTRHLAIKADFDTLLTSGSTVAGTLDLSGTSYVYDNDSGQYVLPANIVPTTVIGVDQTVNSSGLTVTKAGIPTTGAYVKGATSVDALGINLNASVADSLQLNRLTARIYADTATGPFGSATGDTAANTVVLTASLYDGSTLVKGPVNLSLVDIGTAGFVADSGDYYKADFTNLAYSIPAGSQQKLVVRLSLSNNIAGTVYTAVDLDVPGDLEVQNSMGNLVTATPTAALNGTTTKVPYQAIGVSGTLAVSVDGTTPNADIVVAGSTGVNMTKYKMTATNEAFIITGAAIVQSGGATGDIVNVNVTYPNASGTTVTKSGQLSAGVLTFSDGQLDMYVPVNSSAVMTISADLNATAAGATSGSALKLCLDKAATDCGASANLSNAFIALGVSSNTKLFGTTNTITLVDTAVKAQTLRKTKVTAVSTITGGAVSTGTATTIGKFRLTSTAEAGSNQNSIIGAATMQITGGFITAGGNQLVTLSVYKGTIADVNNLMGTGNITVAAGTSTALAITLTANNEFTGEQDIIVVADTTDADFTNTANQDALSTVMTTYTWNDGVDAATVPVAGIPVTPVNALQF